MSVVWKLNFGHLSLLFVQCRREWQLLGEDEKDIVPKEKKKKVRLIKEKQKKPKLKQCVC